MFKSDAGSGLRGETEETVVDSRTKRMNGMYVTLDNLVDLELLRLFMRYQIDFKMLECRAKNRTTCQSQDLPGDNPKQPNHSRCKRRNTNTSTDKQDSIVLQEVLTGRAERSVDHDAGEDSVDGADNLA